jgi:hypothetical protein
VGLLYSVFHQGLELTLLHSNPLMKTNLLSRFCIKIAIVVGR